MRNRLFGAVGLLTAVLLLRPGVNVVGQAPAGRLAVASLAGEGISSRPGPTRAWTREEMEEAEPYPVPEVDAQPGSTSGNETAGVQGFVSGSGPSIASPYSSGPNQPFFSNLVITPDPGYNYPPPFTRYENFPTTTIATYKNFPYRTVGKLFFKQGGKSYVCSASSIGNYAIWTAGHCLHSGGPNGVFSTSVVFVPAYRDGSNPYGQWKAVKLVTTLAWASTSDFRYDYGGAILEAKSGKSISQTVGALNFAWNLPLPSVLSHWTQIGYPADPPFNGKRQWICQSSVAYLDFRRLPPRSVGVGCDMTGGSSGGPWIIEFAGIQGPNTNFLNGNVSFNRAGLTLETFSPYFDDFTKVVRDCLVDSTPAAFVCAGIVDP